MDMILNIIEFCCENALFRLGSYVMKQSEGLPQGNPVSPPLSVIYVMFDEFTHNTTFDRLSFHCDSFYLLLIRYADDLIRFIAAKNISLLLIDKIDNYIMNDLYEHDIKDKNLILVPNNTTKYLDTDIILYNNNTFLKM